MNMAEYIALALPVSFWLWMIVDCIRYETEQEVLWLIVVIFTFFFGARTYSSRKLLHREERIR